MPGSISRVSSAQRHHKLALTTHCITSWELNQELFTRHARTLARNLQLGTIRVELYRRQLKIDDLMPYHILSRLETFRHYNIPMIRLLILPEIVLEPTVAIPNCISLSQPFFCNLEPLQAGNVGYGCAVVSAGCHVRHEWSNGVDPTEAIVRPRGSDGASGLNWRMKGTGDCGAPVVAGHVTGSSIFMRILVPGTLDQVLLAFERLGPFVAILRS
jgi:hypothetical protein